MYLVSFAFETIAAVVWMTRYPEFSRL